MVETIRAPETDLIDTAIVIKNIPFGYAEEDFVNKLFPQLGLVPPYAFNYHRAKADRSFHGLAFANFTAAHEAQAAVDTLNNYELDRRRLRVELKKRLPAEEEQRQRLARQSRRQLPQQVPFTQETTQPVESMPMSSDILDPQLRPRIVFREPPTPSPPTGLPRLVVLILDLDMNDPQTLGFYTTMQLFRNNPEAAGAVLQFPSTLTPTQRRIVRSLAIKLNLDHTSHGVGSDRFITVSRPANATEPTEVSPSKKSDIRRHKYIDHSQQLERAQNNSVSQHPFAPPSLQPPISAPSHRWATFALNDLSVQTHLQCLPCLLSPSTCSLPTKTLSTQTPSATVSVTDQVKKAPYHPDHAPYSIQRVNPTVLHKTKHEDSLLIPHGNNSKFVPLDVPRHRLMGVCLKAVVVEAIS
jgi:hypothetical protein